MLQKDGIMLIFDLINLRINEFKEGRINEFKEGLTDLIMTNIIEDNNRKRNRE